MFKHSFILVLLMLSIIFCYSDPSADQLKNDILEAKKTYDSGDKKQAVELFTKIIGSGKLNTVDLANCYYGRAFAYFGSGNSNKAIMDLRRVIQIEPDNKEAFVKIVQFIDYGAKMNMLFTKDKWSSLSGLKASMANSAANWLRSEGLMGWMILHINELNKIINTSKYDSSLEKTKIANDMPKKLKVAVENFSEIISQDNTPSLKRVVNLFDRSIAYERLQQYEEAISDMEQIILTAPKEPSAKKPVILSELKQLPVFGLYIGQDLDEAKKNALGLLNKYGFKTDLKTLTDKIHAQGHIYVENCNPLTIFANTKRKVTYVTIGKELVDKAFNTKAVSKEAFSKKIISELNLSEFKKAKGLFGSVVWVCQREDGVRVTISESIKTINLQRVSQE